MTTRRVVVGSALVALLAAVGCEPLNVSGSGTGSGTSSTRSPGANRTTSKTSRTVVYEVSRAGGGTRTTTARISTGSTARVSARGTGGGTATCAIVVNGRTLVRRSSSGRNAVVTCSARIGR